MPYTEWILIALLALAGVRGFQKGFIAQITMFVGLLLGIWIAIHFSNFTGNYLTRWFHLEGDNAYIASFVVTFAGVVLMVYFLGKVATRLLRVVLLGWVNKLAGLLFSILKTALLLSVLLNILARTHLNEKLFTTEQRQKIFYRNIEKFAPTIYPSLQKLGQTVTDELRGNEFNEP